MGDYQLQAIEINQSGANIVFAPVESLDIDPGLQHLISRGGGTIHPAFIANIRQRPILRFRTAALAKLLDFVWDATRGVAASPFDGGGSSADEIMLWYQQLEPESGGFYSAAEAKHLKVTVNKGMLVCESLSDNVETADSAMATAAIYPVYDGTNAAVVIEADVVYGCTHPDDENFGVGACWLDGSAVGGLQGIDVNFNYRVKNRGKGGQVWPDFAAIDQSDPVIVLTTPDLSLLDDDNLGLTGAAKTGATKIHFQKVQEGSQFYPAGTATHIRINSSDVQAFPQPLSHGGGGDQNIGIGIRPVGALTLSTTSTIA